MIETAHTGGGAATRRILRLWAADLDVVGERRVPLWLGSIVEEQLYRPASLLTLAWTSERDGAPLGTLPERLPNAPLVERSGTTADPASARTVLLAGAAGGRSPNARTGKAGR